MKKFDIFAAFRLPAMISSVVKCFIFRKGIENLNLQQKILILTWATISLCNRLHIGLKLFTCQEEVNLEKGFRFQVMNRKSN